LWGRFEESGLIPVEQLFLSLASVFSTVTDIFATLLFHQHSI
jgi:hypothetical protein